MPNQHDVSKLIVKYFCDKFKANMYHSSETPIEIGCTVRYSHSQIRDANWPMNEDIGLYLGKKERGQGSSAQVAIPDVALINEDENEVNILIEVESSSNFKDMLHSIGPISMADVYSPTYKFNPRATTPRPNHSSDGNDYLIKNVILFILVLGEHREQFDEMKNRVIQISSKNESLDNKDNKTITVYFDSDNDPNNLVDKFKMKLETIISNNKFNFNVTSTEKKTRDSDKLIEMLKT